MEPIENSASLGQLALAFLRLGVTAFGGPAAHIAMMENEFVVRRRWLSREDFLDLVGAASLIPGPSSSEVAIYIGQKKGGTLGLLVAGVCFILPAALIVSGIAWTYAKYGQMPKMHGALYGIKPVIIAIVLHAGFGLGRTAVKDGFLAFLCATVAALNIWGLSPLTVLLGAGVVSALASVEYQWRSRNLTIIFLAFSFECVRAFSSNIGDGLVGLKHLFFVFLKVGAFQFGSGYVLLAFLQSNLVSRLHWLTENQLLDAIAVGQFTPGPVFTTATFIGYLTRGFLGAVVATVGIFLPAFIFVSVSGPLIPKVRKSKTARAFLDGVNVASVALMAVVAWFLGKAAIFDFTTALITLASLACLVRLRINSTWLVLAGGLIGTFIH